MPIPEHVEEFGPASYFNEGVPWTLYWVRDENILYRNYPIRGAHIPTFRFYMGSFAKDRKNCYCTSSRLVGADPANFRALNYTYVTDGVHVWTMGGQIKDVDAATFVVCDDGVKQLHSGYVPYGFGKDKNRVYYYDFDGKPNWVRKANPATFVSLNDGYIGKDDSFVFCGTAVIPKANVRSWTKIGGNYSKDDSRIFYHNRGVPGADYETFVFVPSGKDYVQLARDKQNFYCNDKPIDEQEFLKLSSGAQKQI